MEEVLFAKILIVCVCVCGGGNYVYSSDAEALFYVTLC